jgi:hypothetical protein
MTASLLIHAVANDSKFPVSGRILLLIVSATLLSIVCNSQPAVRDLRKYMTEVSASINEMIPNSILSDEKHEGKLLDALGTYYTSPSSSIKNKAYYITKSIGQKSKDSDIRRQAVNMLLSGLDEHDPVIAHAIVHALTRFKKHDFSQAAKDSIGAHISANNSNIEGLLKLIGFLDVRGYTPRLHSLINSNAGSGVKWAARLALARMDDQSSIEYIGRKLANAPRDDDFVYEIVPDLVYTRQPELFKFMEEIIASDEENCHSADPDSDRKIPCAYRLLEYIAPVIKDFPLGVDVFGDLTTSDYRAALDQARAWLAENRTYTILKERY